MVDFLNNLVKAIGNFFTSVWNAYVGLLAKFLPQDIAFAFAIGIIVILVLLIFLGFSNRK